MPPALVLVLAGVSLYRAANDRSSRVAPVRPSPCRTPSSGDQDYVAKPANPSVTLDLCGQNPVGLVGAQASATATFISCSTSGAGAPGESRRQEGPYARTCCCVRDVAARFERPR